jgi:large subunit ribosomal protein L3
MSQTFSKNGQVVPVTLIEAGPCVVVQVRTQEKDGYQAVQLGFDNVKEKKLTSPLKGYFDKAGVAPKKYLAELRLDDSEGFQIGQEIKADIFNEGDLVDVVGVSKGKGFAGVIKRWGFHGRPASHGHHYHRAPGSIGSSATPSRVMKGKKLPGHMGVNKTTASSLEVVKVDADKNLLVIKGSVPGPKGGLLMIREAKRSAR